MTNLYVEENWINASEGHRNGDSEIYETFTDNRGELYRAMRREYGRCVSKVYINDGQPVGWVFQKRQQYDDSPETFLLETWVTVYSEPPTETIDHHYA